MRKQVRSRSTGGLACLAIGALATLGAASHSPQTPAQTAPQPRGTGIVVGRVIDAATNAPLAGAMVTLAGSTSLTTGGSGVRTMRVIVDPQGRFVFSGLPAGAFSITATRAGYLAGSYGMLRPDGNPRQLELAAGERVTDATVRLWRFATISGSVTDDAGDPVNYARVQVLKRAIVAGRWRLVNSNQGANADERGVYRVAGLMPGDYALVITSHTSALPVSLLSLADAIKRMPGSDSSGILRELSTNGTGGYASDLMQGFAATRVGDLLLQTSGTSFVGPDGRSIEAYPTVWYPAAATPAEASFVTVGPGDNRTGIDLHPRLTKTLRISGTVFGPDGPVAHLALRLVPAKLDDASAEITSSISQSLTTATSATDVNGVFTFVAVPSGQYVIRTLTTPRPLPEPPPPSGPPPPPLVTTDPTLWAATPVSVGDTDATGVVVTLRAGLRITGRVEFAGAATKPTPNELRAIRVSMDSADGRSVATPSAYQAQIDPNGRFYTIGLIAGRYLLRLDAAPRGWILKSAIVGGRDISDAPLPLETDDVDGLVLTFTDRPSTLAGTIRNAEGRPDDDATVLIFPGDGNWAELGPSPRRLRSARASRNGTFSVTGLPAGEYYVIGVNDAVVSNWQEPAFLQKLARVATRVTLGDGQSLSLNVTTTGSITR